MLKKEITIKTIHGKYDFEIDQVGVRFFVFSVSENLFKSRQTKKIGDAPGWQDAIKLAEAYTGQIAISITEKSTPSN